MRLLIDAGNTRIKWALVDPLLRVTRWRDAEEFDPGWQAHGAVLHADCETLSTCWQNFSVSEVWIANVAGDGVAQQLQRLTQQLFGLTPIWFRAQITAGEVRNLYRDPAQLGCDRFASLIAARWLFPDEAVLVATCGTATTIDALSAAGEFLGGMILPGLGLMTASLSRGTAQLPSVGEVFSLPPLFADETDAAIHSGCLRAQAGAISLALTALPGARCLLSGGAAQLVAQALAVPYHLVDNLVLLGLQAVSSST